MKKKVVLLAAGFLSLVICGFAYAKHTGFSLKVFYNSAGEKVYYPVAEVANPETLRGAVTKQKEDENKSPETAKIGDIFLGEDGYERVIAVSEDGAFVTEQVASDEMDKK